LGLIQPDAVHESFKRAELCAGATAAAKLLRVAAIDANPYNPDLHKINNVLLKRNTPAKSTMLEKPAGIMTTSGASGASRELLQQFVDGEARRFLARGILLECL